MIRLADWLRRKSRGSPVYAVVLSLGMGIPVHHAPRLVAIAAALIAGCAAQPTYYHPTKTQADFERDKYDCEQDAMQRAANAGSPNNPFLIPGYHRDCMIRKHGYTVGPPQPRS